MATIDVYTFEDADGNEPFGFSTQDFAEARRFAAENRLRVICNQYEFADSYEVDDFTGSDEGDSEDEPEDSED